MNDVLTVPPTDRYISLSESVVFSPFGNKNNLQAFWKLQQPVWQKRTTRHVLETSALVATLEMESSDG
jgi:hypothetical protein